MNSTEIVTPETKIDQNDQPALARQPFMLVGNSPFLVVWGTFVLILAFVWYQWGWYIWQLGFIAIASSGLVILSASVCASVYMGIYLADKAFPVYEKYHNLQIPPAKQLPSPPPPRSFRPLPPSRGVKHGS